MKYKIILLIIVITLCFLSFVKTLHADKELPIKPGQFCTEPSYIPPPPPPKPDTLDKYLDTLAMCESGNNPNAINPVDRDGTPSLGRYQFKVGTFNYFSQVFKIATTSIFNGDEQRIIVRKMAQTLTKAQWARQFPDCTLNKSLKYYAGYPPTMLE